MATKAKEGAQLKSRSRSAPTTPSSSSQRKRLGPTGTPDKDAAASPQEKPLPNYLRPTISSGHNSKHQHSESPSKPPITKKPVEKSASSKDKARSLKSPLPKPYNFPNSTPEKASNVKTAKTPTTASAGNKGNNISKGTVSAGATKRRETKAAEKNEEQEKMIPQHAASEESEEARADDTGKEAMLANSSNEEGEDREVEEANVALNNEEAKEKGSPTAYNAVIEETASKLATEKRNKVRALVGAFETVMELEEQQQSPQKGDKGRNVGENQNTEEKKAKTSQEEKKAEEDKNNVEIEHDIEEQEGKMCEEGLTGSMWNGENVKEEVTESAEEGSINTAKELTEESSNGNGEVMGSEEDRRKDDASPKDHLISSSLHLVG